MSNEHITTEDYIAMAGPVQKFISKAESTDELNMLISLVAHAATGAKEIKELELTDVATAAEIINKWTATHQQIASGVDAVIPNEDTPAEQEEEGPGPFPIEPQGTEPDAVLLEEDPPKRRPGRPRKHAEA